MTARSVRRAHPIAEVDPEDLVGPLACLDGGTDHLGLPHGRLRLGHAPHAVALGAQQLLDGGLAEPRLDLRLDHLGAGELLVANAIVGLRRDRAGCFADPHQQLDRHAGPFGQLSEGDAAERREPLERGCVEEVERHRAVPDDGAEAFERDAGRREALHQCRAAQMTRREPAVGGGREDAQLDEPVQLIDADATSLGSLCRVVPLHRRTVRGATSAADARPDGQLIATTDPTRTARASPGPFGFSGSILSEARDDCHRRSVIHLTTDFDRAPTTMGGTNTGSEGDIGHARLQNGGHPERGTRPQPSPRAEHPQAAGRSSAAAAASLGRSTPLERR